MLSIGIFTYSSKPRGSVVHAACLAEALERAGARVTLYALSKSGDAFYRPVSCALHLIPAGPAPADVDGLIRQRIAEFKVGIRVLGARHTVCHAQDCLAANALSQSKSELSSSLAVRTVHHVEDFESPYLRACQERSVAMADLVLTVSEQTRRDVAQSFGRDAPVVCNGVDVQRFAEQDSRVVQKIRQRLDLQPAEPLILSVGGVEQRKNSLLALDAVARAFETQPRLRWAIVGGSSIWEHEPYRAAFTSRMAALPAALRRRITVLGTVPEAELTALYQLSDVLLCPSTKEGFGLCVLEALAARTAVVVPSGAPFDEYLDERCARFVDPNSAEDVARGLTRLLASSEERERLTRAGHERVARYSWDRVAERHLAHYTASLGHYPEPALSRARG